MSFNTANMIVFVLMVLLPLAAVLALEVFLSRRPSWWPGLVLPCSVTLGAFNMIRLMALNFLLAQPTLGAVEVVRDGERFCFHPACRAVHSGVPRAERSAVRDLFSQPEKGAAEVRRNRKQQAKKVKEIPLAVQFRNSGVGFFMRKLCDTRGRYSRLRQASLPSRRQPCLRA